jgi:hypothetical protein
MPYNAEGGARAIGEDGMEHNILYGKIHSNVFGGFGLMKKDKAWDKKDKTKKSLNLFALVLFAIFILAVSWFAGRPLVKFVSAPEAFRAWVDASGVWGRLAFV